MGICWSKPSSVLFYTFGVPKAVSLSNPMETLNFWTPLLFFIFACKHASYFLISYFSFNIYLTILSYYHLAKHKKHQSTHTNTHFFKMFSPRAPSSARTWSASKIIEGKSFMTCFVMALYSSPVFSFPNLFSYNLLPAVTPLNHCHIF